MSNALGCGDALGDGFRCGQLNHGVPVGLAPDVFAVGQGQRAAADEHITLNQLADEREALALLVIIRQQRRHGRRGKGGLAALGAQVAGSGERLHAACVGGQGRPRRVRRRSGRRLERARGIRERHRHRPGLPAAVARRDRRGRGHRLARSSLAGPWPRGNAGRRRRSRLTRSVRRGAGKRPAYEEGDPPFRVDLLLLVTPAGFEPALPP